MKFCIITHVIHGYKGHNHYFGYAPYIREMNIWLKYVEEVIIVAPIKKSKESPIDLTYNHDKILFKEVTSFNLTSVNNVLKAIFNIPRLLFIIYKAMKRADHIHLRCPGNVGLLGCIVQILFPNKKKTAKYAGNWDPKSKQPLSYRIQKWILNNTFLTKNMQVLVYGEWQGTTKNIKPFFTATYSRTEIEPTPTRGLANQIKFIFVGTLSSGKQPLKAIQLVQAIKNKGYNVCLDLFGEGVERENLENYINENHLASYIILKGNQNSETIKKAYQTSNFLILQSKSEGWPKVVAEAMFWGSIPLTTNVSCVHQMIGFGERGILLDEDLNLNVNNITELIDSPEKYQKMSIDAMNWSREYTTEKFESEIKKLLLNNEA